MANVPLELVSDLAREIDIDGAAVVVEPGGIVEVPPDVAGEAATDDDLGWGLLAQGDVWRKASKTKVRKAASADELAVIPDEEQG